MAFLRGINNEAPVQPIYEKIPPCERRALHINQAAEYSGLGRTRLYEFIRSGKIETTTVGKHRLIFRESLDKFLTPKTP
jgi:excisionase family DNA binding protein